MLAVCGADENEVLKHSARDIENAIPEARAYEVNHPEGTTAPEQRNWNLTAPSTFTGTVRAMGIVVGAG